MSTTSHKHDPNFEISPPVTGDPIKRACEILESVSYNRGLIYRCMAKFFTYPDLALLEILKNGELFLQFKQMTAWLGDDQDALLRICEQLQSLPGISLDSLTKDYTRLFEIGVERISPRESSYRWKNVGVITSSEADLQQILNVIYNNSGVSCKTGMEDHIAVELEFLAFLCEQEALRWSSGYSEAARNLRSEQRSFADDHIACWLPEFCFSLQKRNRNSFYGQAAVLCDRWLDLDHGPGYTTLMVFE